MAKRALELLFGRETSEFVISTQTSKFTYSVELFKLLKITGPNLKSLNYFGFIRQKSGGRPKS